MAVYTPTAAALGNITIPADGETIESSDVNVPLQAIADGVAYHATLVLDRIDIIAANHTWTPGVGTTAATVELFGGGGAGGGGDSGNVTGTPWSACSGGGGGGAQPVVGTVQVTAATGYVCTIGAGGTAGPASTNGGDGGDSSFSTLLIGAGGQGGCGTSTGATSTVCLTQGGSPVRNAPAAVKVVSASPPGIQCFADCAPGAGGIGFNAISGSAATKGIGSITGFAGGSAASAGTTNGGFVGAGGAGGAGGTGRILIRYRGPAAVIT